MLKTKLNSQLLSFLLLFITINLLGCSAKKSSYTVIERSDKLSDHQRQKNQVERDIEKSKEHGIDWGEVVTGALVVANSTAQVYNDSLERQNNVKRAQLEVLKAANASNVQNTKSKTNTYIYQSTHSKPQKSSSNYEAKSAQPSRTKNSSTITKSQTTSKGTTIVLGTPTYNIETDSSNEASNNDPKTVYSISKAYVEKNCANFSDVDGLTCRFEKVAICKENEAGFWFCQGHLQYTQAGEKGDKGLKDNLRYAGCKFPHSRTELADSTYLYYCDEPWRQGGAESASISAMESRFSVNVPQTLRDKRKLYQCDKGSDRTCSRVR